MRKNKDSFLAWRIVLTAVGALIIILFSPIASFVFNAGSIVGMAIASI